jgi:hypothetical protein
MGMYTGKPFKQLCRETGAWVWKTPEPVEFNTKRESVPTGSRHGKMQFILIEKHTK